MHEIHDICVICFEITWTSHLCHSVTSSLNFREAANWVSKTSQLSPTVTSQGESHVMSHTSISTTTIFILGISSTSCAMLLGLVHRVPNLQCWRWSALYSYHGESQMYFSLWLSTLSSTPRSVTKCMQWHKTTTRRIGFALSGHNILNYWISQ